VVQWKPPASAVAAMTGQQLCDTARDGDAVTKQLIAARCSVDLREEKGFTALQVAERPGHAAVVKLMRNKKQETPLLGSRVVINGLVAMPELNWRTGTAVNFDDDKGRY
jgi:ankyrin repeat protein